MDAKEVGLIARKYFLETKGSSYFLFDTNKVTKTKMIWEVDCEIKDMIGDGEWRKYTILINDDDGTIVDIVKHD